MNDIKSKLRHKIGRFLIFFSSGFPILILIFSILKLNFSVYYKAFQSAHAFQFIIMIFLFYEHSLSQVSSK